MKKKITVCMLHVNANAENGIQEIYHFFRLPHNEFEVIWDEHHPQYVIATEWIYRDTLCYKKFNRLKRDNPKSIFIFVAGECVIPDLNVFDYAICYQDDLEMSDRVIQHYREEHIWFNEGKSQNTISYDEALNEYGKRKFCSFIYSNYLAHPRRDELFYLIAEYKQIDSLGRHLHNTDTEVTRNELNWREISVMDKGKYRFAIACENAGVSGYVSEKIITSLQAHSIPIYWGSKSIEKDFNSDCFINAGKYTDAELLKVISEIDRSPEKWAKMVSAPWRTEEQIIQSKIKMRKYENFTRYIFSQEMSDAKRTDIGNWADVYEEFFFRSGVSKFKLNRFFMKKVTHKLQKDFAKKISGVKK